MTGKKFTAFFIGWYLAILLTNATAGAIGTAVAVFPGANLTHLQQSTELSAGAGVSTGDIITTDRTGQVQLIFNDETRVAIGPNSRFIVEDVALKSGGTASRFAVSAVAGSFRFITGKSKKSAYAINTPTATMGIRGTVFDFVVRKRHGTDLVIFSGEVRMCSKDGNCFKVVGECAAVQMDTAGNFSTVKKKADKRDLIAHGFLFVSAQQQLAPEFRAEVRSCGRDVVGPLPQPKDNSAAPQRSPTPQPPGPPEPQDPPEPPIEPGGI